MEERLNAIVTMLNDQLPEGYILASLEQVPTSRGICTGIICRHETNASPVFYTDMLPNLDDITNQEAVNFIVNTILIQDPVTMQTFVDLVKEFGEETMKHLTLRVVNKSRMNELPDYISYFSVRETLDLICYLTIDLWIDDISETGSIAVTDSLLRYWNMAEREKELVDRAIQNIQSNVKITSMAELLMEHAVEVAKEDVEIPMFVVTNTTGIYGANVIFANSPFDSIADHFDTNGVIILPSSIHDLLAIPCDAPNEVLIEAFTRMVREVNTEQLLPNDILSDHPYYYDYNTEKIIPLFPGVKNIL